MKNIDNEILYVIPALFIRANNAIKFIPFDHVLYLKAEGSYTTIVLHNHDKEHLSSMSLGQIEQRLNCPFIFRVHRSYMVNFKYITGLVGNAIRLDKDLIPIGRTYRHVLNRFVII